MQLAIIVLCLVIGTFSYTCAEYITRENRKYFLLTYLSILMSLVASALLLIKMNG